MRAAGLPPLILISDAARVGEERFLDALRAAIEGGLRMVQVREPSWTLGDVRRLLQRVKETAARGPAAGRFRIVVNRSLALALELGLDGLHLGGGDPAALTGARTALGHGPLLGYSAHSGEEIGAASLRGADYVSLSPIYGAISKRHPLPPLGLEALGAACGTATVPVYALGGVEPRHAAELRRAGAAGGAMIGGILDAPDPGQAARGFIDAWEAARA
ncbi:MAG TPA: thiamine phosphate synthase [Planctomycetota bacterium]|nr:thiamine phosphate synthase [Planctomycetota bacterium]